MYPRLANRSSSAGNDLGIAAERQSQSFRHRFAREVVLGGAQAAGENNDVGAPHSQLGRSDEALAVIADDRLEAHLDSQVVELLGEVERVGVLPVGSEQLRPHGDDLGIHG